MYKKIAIFSCLVIFGLIFPACQNNPEVSIQKETEQTIMPKILTREIYQSTSSATAYKTAEIIPNTPTHIETDKVTAEPMGFVFSEMGPYQVGVKGEITFQDISRNNRKITITIWYPAISGTESADYTAAHDAQANLSGSPYPIILSSSKVGYRFATILASYGFIYVGIDDIDTYDYFDYNIIDQPLDILYALNQVSTTPISGLEGMIDTHNTGVMGYSFDGVNALILSGAKINPDFYLSYCEDAIDFDPPLEDWYFDLECTLSKNWDEFIIYASNNFSVDNNGLWSPLSEQIFKAAMPMAADGAWLFGENGLADVEIPVLLIQTKYDSPYQIIEAKFIFEHLGTTEKQMITFLEKGHMMIYDPESVSKMAHFAVSFFGYHLQGHEEYAQYFSKEFIDQYEDLYFGFYEE